MIATDIMSRRDATRRRRSEKSNQIREMELQLELKRMELESKKIEKNAELEQRRIDAETENRRIEAEARARELQNKREKREHELKVVEAGRPAEWGERGGYDNQNVDEDGDKRVETLADRVKRYVLP